MKLFIVLISLISFQSMSAQNLTEYKWKNRLIIIFTQSSDSKNAEEQLNKLKKDADGLKERKLKIIHSIPGEYQVVFPEISDWQDSDLYRKMKQEEDRFEIILIGLDGGVKLRQTELLTLSKLFQTIDSMPMRKAEMRKNNP